jgi:hypothetical protein
MPYKKTYGESFDIIYSTECKEYDLRSVIDSLWNTDKVLYSVEKLKNTDVYNRYLYLVKYTEPK